MRVRRFHLACVVIVAATAFAVSPLMKTSCSATNVPPTVVKPAPASSGPIPDPVPTTQPTPPPTPSPAKPVTAITANRPHRFQVNPKPGAAEAKAVISLDDGTAVPTQWPIGDVLSLSAIQSTRSPGSKSVAWDVDPPALAQRSRLSSDGLNLSIPTGLDELTVTVRLAVANDGAVDVSVQRIALKSTRRPDPPAPDPVVPKPDPVDPPNPLPVPPVDPSATIDPTLRAAAAAYFRVYTREYSLLDSLAAANNYNHVMEAMKTDRTATGTALGKALDNILQPLLNPDLTYKDAEAGKKASKLVQDSINAGIIDALTTPRP